MYRYDETLRQNYTTWQLIGKTKVQEPTVKIKTNTAGKKSVQVQKIHETSQTETQ